MIDKMISREVNMAVSYKRLFHLLIERGIATSELTERAGFSANILTRLRRDQYVSLESIEKICATLNCKVDDILEFNQQITQEGK
jgi:DNA-binding Xre family transcriptional regulator